MRRRAIFPPRDVDPARQAEMERKVREIAEHLGPDWTYRPGPLSFACIRGSGEMALHFFWSRYPGVWVKGVLPASLELGVGPNPEDQEAVTVGLTLTRLPADLARDLKRRLLPGYVECYNRLEARLQARREHREGTRLCHAQAERMLPAELGSLRLLPRDPETVTVSLDLTPDLLGRLIEGLAPEGEAAEP